MFIVSFTDPAIELSMFIVSFTDSAIELSMFIVSFTDSDKHGQYNSRVSE
jgi:hypothetical protein